VIVGSFDGDVMQPLVMGKAVNLHPLAIIMAIAAGSIALGIVGALIAVPIAGAVYGVAKYLTGRDPDNAYPPTQPFVPVPDTP
jgi:predicted PurR-regulated permease PerM